VGWITSKIYENVLSELIAHGVEVKIICNDDPINSRTGVWNIPNIQLYKIKPVVARGFMHNKFSIIDDEIIINLSYN
jgi:phosphatidylserine/phosphatidylglycerophosphate/cardiolipin synthase-like enzyme